MAAVTELRRDYPLAALLKLAGIPRSTYYYHSRKANAVDKYAKERAEIIAIYQENQGRYGYRRIGMELRNRGFCLNHKTVQKLMKESGLKCMVRMKKYRSYRGEVGKIAPNLLARDFHAERPNQKWVTDVTEFSLFGSKLYLSPVLDLYNGEIISYAISERANYRQVDEMLDKAFSRLPDSSGLILHSDQGWQYQNVRYQKRLLEKGIRQSMSRKGNCLDNAVITDYDCSIHGVSNLLGEYENLDKLNYLAARLDEMSRSELEHFVAIMDSGCDEVNDLDDLINLTYNLDNYDFIPDIKDYDDLGRYYFFEGGYNIDNKFGSFVDYIDFERYGEDCAINEGGTLTDAGYIRPTGDSWNRYFDGTLEDMENFFGLLKSELLYLRTFQSLDEFCQELIAYLEYYNHNRIKEKLNGLSPVQYRIQNGFAA